MTLECELDRLFQLPLRDFVSARNRLAARLKSSGDPAGSQRVRAVPKPSAAAWALNQLYWTARPVFEALAAAGDRYRSAQRAALSGGGVEGLDEAEGERQRAVEEALRTVRRILDAGGQTSGPTMLQKITTTLEALVSYGSTNPDPPRGRMTSELHTPGFSILADVAPAPPGPRSETPRAEAPPRSAKEGDELYRATRELEVEEEGLAAARRIVEGATVDAARALSELEAARAKCRELEAASSRAMAELETARQHSMSREAQVEQARRRVEEASDTRNSGRRQG